MPLAYYEIPSTERQREFPLNTIKSTNTLARNISQLNSSTPVLGRRMPFLTYSLFRVTLNNLPENIQKYFGWRQFKKDRFFWSVLTRIQLIEDSVMCLWVRLVSNFIFEEYLICSEILLWTMYIQNLCFFVNQRNFTLWVPWQGCNDNLVTPTKWHNDYSMQIKRLGCVIQINRHRILNISWFVHCYLILCKRQKMSNLFYMMMER